MAPRVISHKTFKKKLNKEILKVYTSHGSHVISHKTFKKKLNKEILKVYTSHDSPCDFT
jgi:hypothetical protein